MLDELLKINATKKKLKWSCTNKSRKWENSRPLYHTMQFYNVISEHSLEHIKYLTIYIIHFSLAMDGQQMGAFCLAASLRVLPRHSRTDEFVTGLSISIVRPSRSTQGCPRGWKFKIQFGANHPENSQNNVESLLKSKHQRTQSIRSKPGHSFCITQYHLLFVISNSSTYCWKSWQ